MKKILLIALALICATMAHGQDQKEKVAIYTTDNSGQNIVEFVGDFLTNAIVKRGQYTAIERTAQFLAELNKEQSFQRTGAVDDSQISRLGKNMGVQLVCVVKIGKSGEQLFISARLVDVETAALKSSARPVRFDADNWDGIEKCCETITASMFGGGNDSSSSLGNHSSGNTSSGNKSSNADVTANNTPANEANVTDAPANGSVYNPDGIEMVYVEGTGSGIGAIQGFYIGKYEVTQVQYEAVMGVNPSHFKGSNYPVETVSWDDAQEFIVKLNARTGRNYRLPTESEWEYAFREGKNNSSYEYSGSNDLKAVAWYHGNSKNQTHPVGQLLPNALGIYDMTGNVNEWCQDYKNEKKNYRALKGGCFLHMKVHFKMIKKVLGDKATNKGPAAGFRVVCDLE
jgi:TolB-like protein